MTETTAFKRKRVTEDVLTFSPSSNVVIHQDTNQDKILKIQLKLERLETENYKLVKQIEISNITHSMNFKESTHKVTELISERNEFKAQAIFHQKRAKNASETLDIIKKEHIQVTENLRKTMEGARNKIQHLEEALNEKEHESKEIEMSHQSEISTCTIQNERYKEEISSLEKAVQRKDDQRQVAAAREMELTKRVIHLESKLGEVAVSQATELNNELQESILQDYTRIYNDLTELQKKDTQLSSELDHYKSIYQNAEYLRAENNSLQQRVSDVDEVKKAKLLLEIENANLRAERDAWTRYLDSKPEYNHQTPSTIIFNLSNRADEANYLDLRVKQLVSELENKTQLIYKLEDHIHELKTSHYEHKVAKAISDEESNLNKQREDVLKKHISILQDQLHLYDAEEKVNMETTYDQKKTLRIAQLEMFLRELENKLSTQAQEFIKSLNREPGPVPNGPYEQLSSGVKIVDFLKEIYQEKERYIQDFKEAKANAKKHFSECIDRPQEEQEQAPETQEDIPANVRVLSLSQNPASELFAIRRDLLQRLQRENKELLDMKLEKATDFETVSLPKSSIINFEKEEERLQKECESLNKRIDRLNDAWNEKILEILAKVQDCWGYKLIFRTGGVIKFESVFVDGSELAFLLKEVNGPNEALLRVTGSKKNEYLVQFGDIYQNYVIEKKNISAFLNAVALELYVESTIPESVDGDRPSYDQSPSINEEDNYDAMDIEPVSDQGGFKIHRDIDFDEEEEGYEESDNELLETYEEAQGVFDDSENDSAEYRDEVAYLEGHYDTQQDCEDDEEDVEYEEYDEVGNDEDIDEAENDKDNYEAGDDKEASPEPTEPVEILLLDSDSD